MVSGRLAASGQIFGPVIGAWWHAGEYGEGEEWVVLMKTSAARYPELERHLLEAHPWDNPEITTYPIGGPTPYLEWITKSTTP
ncbi:divalent-cation tolerance protein CutA [Thermomonospora amylolytica]|uniref:divalent-cation tolerance protein CutA n=1 Tax=Thermomonospora amylolytica TaxID=1411117 RepID=UPI001F342DB9|nr:divalent cation tolerance protein CutA [Thermomonospora amylolytica]